MSEYEYSGYLQDVSGKFYKKSHVRYFELYGSMLYYWKSRPLNKDVVPIGSIDLTNTRIVNIKKDPKSWRLEGDHLPRTYTFTAETEEQKEAWTTKLMNINSRNLTRFGTMEHDASEEDEVVTVFSVQQKDVSLDDFEVKATIGAGSFSNVFVARKISTNEIYAIKEMKKEVIEKQQMLDNIAAEKHILQRISHPFIVKLHYAFQTKNCLYLVLDFLSGGELFFHLNKEGFFDEYRAKFYCGEIALAIGYLHSVDIIFRDLKPENVVLDKDGHVCITDFGLAKMGFSNACNITFCGTTEYIAPECLLGQPHGKAVDWWALGILLYEMLEGIPPFFSDNPNETYDIILKGELRFGGGSGDRSDLPAISDAAQDLLRKLLDRDPATRLQDLEEFKKHPFFDDIDWTKLSNREVEPPFRPSNNALVNFDEDFTSQEPRVGVQEEDVCEHANISDFTFNGGKNSV